MHKKGHKLKTSPLVKNPQFSSNLADIQAKLPTHETIILTKFHKECKKVVDFLHRTKFLAYALFYASPFIKLLDSGSKKQVFIFYSNSYLSELVVQSVRAILSYTKFFTKL